MRRITELDAIRGLAAMAVMIYHLKPQAFALKGSVSISFSYYPAIS